MKKQTAVDWLISQVEDHSGLIPVDIIEKAKAMEREQIEEAVKDITLRYLPYLEDTKDLADIAQEYYTQTHEKPIAEERAESGREEYQRQCDETVRNDKRNK